ncbi:MAG TPA: DMT family transporter [Marmoricola sp.]
MFVLAVILAVVAAGLIACGAEFQEHAAVRVGPSGRQVVGFFVRLLRDARWVAGALLAACGVGLHIVALTAGPVTAIQPVGSVGLLFAIGIKAIVDRTRFERLAITGSLAVIAGLATLLAALPHTAGTSTLRTAPAAAAGTGAVVLTGAALLLPARRVRPALRAGAIALGSGMCFGVAAAVVGVIGRRVEGDLAAVLDWPTLLVIVLLVAGGAAQQLAYRTARFAVVYAVLLTADPVTAGAAGVLLLGDPLPSTPARLAALALAALVAVAGIVVLAHARAANRAGTDQEQPCAS